MEATELPDHDAYDGQATEDGAEHHAGGHFAQGHLPPVAQAQFAQRQAADQQRGRLRTGVATRAHDQRNEQGQHHRARQFVLVVLHRAGGQHLADEQHAQPAGALAQHLEEADLHVRLVQRLHAAELVRVFGGLFDQRIEDVIDGDDAEHVLLRVHHRNGQQIVAADQPRHVFLVHLRIHHHRRIDLGHVQDRFLRQPGDQPAHGHHLLQLLVGRVEHVDRIHGLARAFDLADVLQGLGHGPGGGHGDELGGHQRTGGVRRVAQQLLDGLPDFVAQQRNQPRAFFFIQLVDDIGGTVVGHQPQQRGGARRRQCGNQFATAVQLRRLEHLHCARQRQRGQRLGGALQFERVEEFHRVGGVVVRQRCRQCCGIGHRTQQLLLVHGDSPSWGATSRNANAGKPSRCQAVAIAGVDRGRLLLSLDMGWGLRRGVLPDTPAAAGSLDLRSVQVNPPR